MPSSHLIPASINEEENPITDTEEIVYLLELADGGRR